MPTARVRWALALSLCLFTSIASDASRAYAQNDPRGDLGTQILGGSLGWFAGAAIGAGTFYFMASDDDCVELCPFGVFVFGSGLGVVSMLALVPLGVQLAGDHTGGNGGAGFSVLGAVLGTGASAGALMLLRPREDWMAIPSVVGASALMITGAILGYRWSSDLPIRMGVSPTADAKGLFFTLEGRG